MVDGLLETQDVWLALVRPAAQPCALATGFAGAVRLVYNVTHVPAAAPADPAPGVLGASSKQKSLWFRPSGHSRSCSA